MFAYNVNHITFDSTFKRKAMITEPKFDLDSFTDLLFDEDGNSYLTKIDYEYVHYDGACRVYKCDVSTSYRHVTQDDIYEVLYLREGKRIEFECTINFV